MFLCTLGTFLSLPLYVILTDNYELRNDEKTKQKLNKYTCFFLENTKFNYFTTANYIYRSSLVFLSINHPYRFPFICLFSFYTYTFPKFILYNAPIFICPQFFFNPNILKNEKILTTNLLITYLEAASSKFSTKSGISSSSSSSSAPSPEYEDAIFLRLARLSGPN